MPVASPPSTSPFRLGLVLFPGCMPAGLFAAGDMVRACNLRAGRVQMTATWVGAELGEVPTHQGPSLRVQSTVAEAACDAWLLPGLWLTSTAALDGAVRAQGRLVDALRAQPRRAQVWSYCAGVALAAAAERLDRHAATATWWLRPALAAQFKRVRWQGGSDLVVDRHAITAAGPGGYLPLMLDRLAQHFADDVLQDVQELLMLPSPRRRHPSFEPVEMMRLNDPAMRALLAWARCTPAQDVTLAGAARQQSISVRTLARLVDRAAGMGAGEWLRLAKLSQAAEALRSTRTPIKAISEDLGFGSEASLYRALRAATGMTPSAYRQAYGSTARSRPIVAERAPR
ncbi:AraC family transcriptional regulator with amidase-like domain [Roseateles saccharophilus]|uniref:AraC family transcriptional regulator with amidase-like domain n=2 Tax=Roseateles saccharophilus TaxID=304 RepID=A0A4R3UDH3_ROSSA|nr:helix-turn-helix domain-containing protein [Roseateles saccharophilus]TCU85126.1 AraC family transcriptional regulator with amidase-like domain [Roseateles saccharophilus]